MNQYYLIAAIAGAAAVIAGLIASAEARRRTVKLAKAALNGSDSFGTCVIDASSDEPKIVFANSEFLKICGIKDTKPGALRVSIPATRINDEFSADIIRAIKETAQTGERAECTFKGTYNGDYHWLHMHCSPSAMSGKKKYVTAVMLGVTDIQMQAIVYEKRHQRSKLLEQTCRDVVFDFDVESGAVSYSYENDGEVEVKVFDSLDQDNGMIASIYKDDKDKVYAAIKQAVADGKQSTIEYRSKLGCDDYEWHRLILNPLTDELGCVLRVAARSENIHELVSEREHVRRAAETDLMTGVYNKVRFSELASQRLAANGGAGCLIMIDLDDFKTINDTFGHSRGDEALKLTSMALTEAASPEDVVGRFGGDEFVVFSQSCKEEVIKKIDALRTKVAEDEPQRGYPLTLSVGAAYSEGGVEDTDSLFRIADHAMYMVKSRGKNGYEIFRTGELSEDDEVEKEAEAAAAAAEAAQAAEEAEQQTEE